MSTTRKQKNRRRRETEGEWKLCLHRCVATFLSLLSHVHILSTPAEPGQASLGLSPFRFPPPETSSESLFFPSVRRAAIDDFIPEVWYVTATLLFSFSVWWMAYTWPTQGRALHRSGCKGTNELLGAIFPCSLSRPFLFWPIPSLHICVMCLSFPLSFYVCK